MWGCVAFLLRPWGRRRVRDRCESVVSAIGEFLPSVALPEVLRPNIAGGMAQSNGW